MNKRRSGGFTLIEMLVAIVIIILLVIGIDTGSRAALKAYKVSVFESECATLSDILNTSISDVLRYCAVENAASIGEEGSDEYTFSSVDYAVSHASLVADTFDDNRSMVYVRGRTFGDNGDINGLLVNAGSYPNLTVTGLSTRFFPTVYVGGKASAGYFRVEYTIASAKDAALTNTYSFYIRQVNADISRNLAKDAFSTEGIAVSDDPSSGETSVNTCLITYDQNLAGNGVLRYLNTNSYRTAIIKSVPKGSTAQVAVIEHNYSRHELVGWSDTPGATTPKYVAGNEIVVDKDITLYAVWQGAKMNLTLHCINANGETTSQFTYRYGDTVGTVGQPSSFSFPVTLRFRVKPSDEVVANKDANRPFLGWGLKEQGKWNSDTSNLLSNGYVLTENDSGRDLYAYWGSVYIDVKNPTYVKNNWHDTWFFEGTWYKIDKDNTVNVTGRTLTGTTDVYAVLKRTIKYSFGSNTYTDQSGKAISVPDPVSYYSYQNPPAMASLSYDNYTVKWYKEAALTNEITSLSQANYDSNGVATVYAKFIPKCGFSISSVNANAGSDSVTNLPSTSALVWSDGSSKTYTLSVPSRTGYTFAGWAVSATNGGSGTVSSDYKTLTVTGVSGKEVAVTLTAKWTENTYKITYYPNGGSGSEQTKEYKYTESITLKNMFSYSKAYTVTFIAKAGDSTSQSQATASCIFDGWAESSGAAAAKYSNGATVSKLTSTNGDKVSLYAVWKGSNVTMPSKPSISGWHLDGWATSASAASPTANVGSSVTIEKNCTYYAVLSRTITYDANGGSVDRASDKYYSSGSAPTSLPTPTRDHYKFLGWYTSKDGGTKVENLSGLSYSADGACTLYAHWEIETFKLEVTIDFQTEKPTIKLHFTLPQDNPKNFAATHSRQITADETWTLEGIPYGSTVYYDNSSDFADFNPPEYSYDNKKWSSWKAQSAIEITGDTYAKFTSANCIASGTLITMADGSQKKIEDITLDDKVLVFNHETGKPEAANINFIEADGWADYEIINLEWSNGEKSRIIYEHGFFDLDLMKYVYIHADDYEQYVGHRFYTGKVVNGKYISSSVTLDKAYITHEYVGCYSFPTIYHLNFFMDDMLSMPGGIEGMFNIFEYSSSLKYDKGKMQKDINKYGLFEYENLANYMSYEDFCKYPAQYINVSLGKGIITEEDLMYLVERYAVKYAGD